MPGTLIEQHGSRWFKIGTTGSSAGFIYFAFGETDEAAVHVLLAANAPIVWNGYVRGEFDCKRRNALDQWDCNVNYVLPVYAPGDPLPVGGPGTPGGGGSPPSSPPPPAGGDVVKGIDFSVTTETVHVDRSVAVAQHAGGPNQGAIPGATVPANGRLIGVTNDGKIEGVDKNSVPLVTIRIRTTLPPGILVYDYLRTILRVVGKTNAAPWWEFGQEEGLFIGLEGQEKPSGIYDVTYTFQGNFTKENVSLTESPEPALVIPIVRGWHYIEAFKRWDVEGGIRVLRIYAYRVHQVYETEHFSWLGIAP